MIAAVVPLKVTAEAEPKFVPLMTTGVPTGPAVGLNPVMVGTGTVTVKFVAAVAVPPAVVTVNFPVVAPLGTVAVICVELFTVYVAVVPLSFTEVAPVKFVPVIVTDVAAGPLDGEKFVIVGEATVVVTVKFEAEVPLPFTVVTETFPVAAPLGTVAVICVALFTL